MTALKPEFPPSPPTLSNQLLSLPLYDQVPLSCVPPSSSRRGSCGLRDTLWNCSVAKPALRLMISTGIAFSQRRQLARSLPLMPRPEHPPDASANLPSVRTTPPSEPTMAMSGLAGWKTIACWSGCMPTGAGPWVSLVMSVNCTPALVDRCTARPLDGGVPVKISAYCIWPPIHAVSGLPAGEATTMS